MSGADPRDKDKTSDQGSLPEPSSPVTPAAVTTEPPTTDRSRADQEALEALEALDRQQVPPLTTRLWRRVSIDVALVAAILTAGLYVSLAALYGRFYQVLDTRPEEVGLDRIAILTRTFWVAYIVVVVGVAAGLALWFSFMLGLWRATRRLLRLLRRESALRVGGSGLPRSDEASRKLPENSVGGSCQSSVEEGKEIRTDAKASQIGYDIAMHHEAIRVLRRQFNEGMRIFIAVILTVVLFTGLTVMVSAAMRTVEGRAQEAQRGAAVSPIRLGWLLIIDVSATPARVAWLDKDVGQELILSDPWLLYLGRSDKVAVFIACGRTVITPADKVEVITRGAVGRVSASVREGFCDKVS